MVDSFLKNVVSEVCENHNDLNELIFIVPSIRAGRFLKKELLSHLSDRTLFAPQIISIEEFIMQVSGLTQINSIQVLFEFYEAYIKTITHRKKESFESFSSWATTLIQDFNEIDRYCLNHNKFFNHWSDIQELNHWSQKDHKTELIEKYLAFWNDLPHYYETFTESLLRKKIGYQGLLYRKAADNMDDYSEKTKMFHVFLGFNALNQSEQQIFKKLVHKNQASIYWDADKFFLQNSYHQAGFFQRAYQKSWSYYEQHPFSWIQDHFSGKKHIEAIAVSKKIGQAKMVGQLLEEFSEHQLENAAVVLADEALLLPILTSLPNTISALNITMGLPLREIPLTHFFEHLFELHLQKNNHRFHYRIITKILYSPPGKWLLDNEAEKIIHAIKEKNLVYLDVEILFSLTTQVYRPILSILFSDWNNASEAIDNSTQLIQLLKEKANLQQDSLYKEYIYRFYNIFNQLSTYQSQYSFLTTVASLHKIFKDCIEYEQLDFQGEAFQGLQIMGMLESRCLDFETVIITSVNEGTLPAGKSANSFIPFDLKKAYKLPTYKEKDAVYAYHFYRLLQRAKNIYLLYDTDNTGLNSGEKSRFIHQLKLDKRPQHQYQEFTVTTDIPSLKQQLKIIQKNDAIFQQLKNLATHGFSPSALTTYIRNPIDFYHRYVLKIKETEEVEETIAANTLGTVIHDTLEHFYKPLENQIITVEHIRAMKSITQETIKKQFYKTYRNLDITQGKNLLIYEVVKQYIVRFLAYEEKSIKKGNQTKILAIEAPLKKELKINHLDFPIYLKGKVDRIDEINGNRRIIDYKTGAVQKGELFLTEWEPMIEDYKFSKAFQVLTYTFMQSDEDLSHFTSCSAGIFSFKNFKEGFMSFGTKPSPGSRTVDSLITKKTLKSYQDQLYSLIVQIFDKNLPFAEKEIEQPW